MLSSFLFCCVEIVHGHLCKVGGPHRHHRLVDVKKLRMVGWLPPAPSAAKAPRPAMVYSEKSSEPDMCVSPMVAKEGSSTTFLAAS